MKKLLLTLLLGVAQFGFAQLTCATATPITTNGTITIANVNGTYVPPGCPAGTPSPAPTAAMWYQYTPTTNGTLTITSDLPQNDGTAKSNETRLSVYNGTCGTLTCVANSDDISATNFLSTVTAVPVIAGTTYYIQWDNGWGATLGFDFSVNFTAVSCLPVTGSTLTLTNVTATTATLGWTAVPGAASYDIEYGAPGFVQGTGTVVNTTTPSATITFPTAGGNYYFYLRSNCGATQSTWIGPYAIYLVKTIPYSTSFETAPAFSDGFVAAGWSLNTTQPTFAHNGSNFYFTNTSATAVSNSQLYSRPLAMNAGTSVTLKFWTRSTSATVPGTVKVYYNTTRSLTNATQIGSNISVVGQTYTEQTVVFTPPSGTHYLIFSNESAITPTVASLLLDSFSTTSVLGTQENIMENNFVSLYPNPTSDVLNIRSKDKVNAVSVYDIAGRKIEVKLKDNTVNVKSLQSGTYIITVETSKGKTSEKFIKK